ncbi:YihY/virulence factor BrkB family protein, partial [bacterium]
MMIWLNRRRQSWYKGGEGVLFMAKDNFLTGFLKGKKKQSPLLEPLRLGGVALWKFLRDGGVVRASSLTYTTTLSLVPFLILFFSIIKALGAQRTLEPLFLDYFATNNRPLAEKIIGFVDNTNVGALGVFGFLALCLTATSLLVSVEKAFNSFWGAASGRSFLRRVTDYTAIMVACPLLLIFSTSVVTTEKVRELFNAGVARHALWLFFAFAPFFAKSLAFGAAYLIMPNRRVKFTSALLGGVVAGIMWHIAEWVYISLQMKVGRYDAIYGALAQLPLFLVWVYLGWCVVLYGAELACVYELPGRGRHLLDKGEELWMPRPGAYLPALREIAAKFHGGEMMPTALELLERSGHNPSEGMKVLNLLASEGFLTFTADNPPRLLPARHPGR